ncbi:MAG: ankyrin repeat domain-containing protein [Candidatus Babeliales bacterium]|nr:ankyrin repeat domain-containing protein [Candidatus Babeliales bacterium]
MLYKMIFAASTTILMLSNLDGSAPSWDSLDDFVLDQAASSMPRPNNQARASARNRPPALPSVRRAWASRFSPDLSSPEPHSVHNNTPTSPIEHHNDEPNFHDQHDDSDDDNDEPNFHSQHDDNRNENANRPASPSLSIPSCQSDDDDCIPECQQLISSVDRLFECKYDNENYCHAASSTAPRQVVRIHDYRKSKENREKQRIAYIKMCQRNIKRVLLIKSLQKNESAIRANAVINAIKDNDAIELQYLIKEKKCPADAQVNDEIALMLAARDSKLKCLKVLLDNGANPNFVDQDGNSLLYRTAYRGHDMCARLLKKSGAHHTPVDPLAKNIGNYNEYMKNLLIDGALCIAQRELAQSTLTNKAKIKLTNKKLTTKTD